MPNVGDTVYFLTSTETYREIKAAVVIGTSYGDLVRLEGHGKQRNLRSLYATQEGAQRARLAYYARRARSAERAIDNARAHLSNMVGWRERAQREMEATPSASP